MTEEQNMVGFWIAIGITICVFGTIMLITSRQQIRESRNPKLKPKPKQDMPMIIAGQQDTAYIRIDVVYRAMMSAKIAQLRSKGIMADARSCQDILTNVLKKENTK